MSKSDQSRRTSALVAAVTVVVAVVVAVVVVLVVVDVVVVAADGVFFESIISCRRCFATCRTAAVNNCTTSASGAKATHGRKAFKAAIHPLVNTANGGCSNNTCERSRGMNV